MLTLGFLSLGAINWFRKDHPTLLALKLGCGGIAIICALATGERGIWIAIPVLLLLWAHYGFSLKTRAAIGTISIAAALAAYWAIPEIPKRIAYTETELQKIFAGDLSSSYGQRLQIYRVAVEAIREHPLAGVGPEGAPDLFRSMARRGWFTTVGLHAGLSQVHNEILANTLRLGIFGLFSILAIYFVPLTLFISEARARDSIRDAATLMGAMIVLAYFIFGLSIEVFNLKMFATFYSVGVATFMAIVRGGKQVAISSHTLRR